MEKLRAEHALMGASKKDDAYEERDIATFNIPGAYLHAEIPADKNVIIKLRGHFVDIMCDINE